MVQSQGWVDSVQVALSHLEDDEVEEAAGPTAAEVWGWCGCV